MSTYFWGDPYIESLKALEKLLYAYLCFNQHDNLSGVYLISRGTMAGETGLSIEQVSEFLGRFESDGKVIYRDNIVAVKNRIKNNNLKNVFIRKNILRSLKSAPSWAYEFVDKDELLQEESLRSPQGPVTAQGNSKGKGNSISKDFKVLRSKAFNPLGWFIDEYKRHRGVNYANAVPGKDGSLLKVIVKDNGEEKYKAALEIFWKSKDKFVLGRKYDVVAFNSVINSLLQEQSVATTTAPAYMPKKV